MSPPAGRFCLQCDVPVKDESPGLGYSCKDGQFQTDSGCPDPHPLPWSKGGGQTHQPPPYTISGTPAGGMAKMAIWETVFRPQCRGSKMGIVVRPQCRWSKRHPLNVLIHRHVPFRPFSCTLLLRKLRCFSDKRGHAAVLATHSARASGRGWTHYRFPQVWGGGPPPSPPNVGYPGAMPLRASGPRRVPSPLPLYELQLWHTLVPSMPALSPA